MGGALIILAMRFDRIPEVLYQIFYSAWNGQAAAGGFMGATVLMAMQQGVARSIFSMRLALGISSIAAAAAKTDSPGRQGMIIMTGALVSTVIVCTMTGLVLGVTGVLGTTAPSGELLTGASLAITAIPHLRWLAETWWLLSA